MPSVVTALALCRTRPRCPHGRGVQDREKPPALACRRLVPRRGGVCRLGGEDLPRRVSPHFPGDDPRGSRQKCAEMLFDPVRRQGIELLAIRAVGEEAG